MLGSESPIPAQGGGATARDPECKGNTLLSPGPSDLCRLVFPFFCLFPSLSLFLSHTRKHTQLTLHPAPGWLHPPPPLCLLLLNQWISGSADSSAGALAGGAQGHWLRRSKSWGRGLICSQRTFQGGGTGCFSEILFLTPVPPTRSQQQNPEPPCASPK